MSAIHFDITGDNKHLVSVINDTTKRMEEMSKTVKDLGRHFDMSSTEAQLKSLNTVIEDQEAVLEELGKQLDELAEKQQQAAEAGDTKAVADYGRQMTQLAGEIKTAKDELDQFKSAQQILSNQTEESAETTKKAYGDNVGALEKLVGGSKNYTNILRFLPGPIRNVARGINSITNAAKAFLMTPIGAALAAIAVALKAVSFWVNNTAEGAKSLKRVADAFEELSIKVTGTSKKIKQLQEATRQGAAGQVASLFKLQKQWEKANGNLEKQKKILASKEWDNLGLAVNSVNDAERILVNNSNDVIKAFAARAKAAALYKKAEEQAEEWLRVYDLEMSENETNKAKANRKQQRLEEFNQALNLITSNPNGDQRSDFVKKRDERTLRRLQKQADKANAKVHTEEEIRNAIGIYENDIMDTIKKAIEQDSEADDIIAALGVQPTDKDYEQYKASWQRFNDYLRQFAEEQRRLKTDLRNQTEQAEIDAMAEGNEKQLRQMELNHEMQLEEIRRWYKDLREAKIKNAREQFESNPANEGKAFTYDANSAAFDATPEELALYNAKVAAENATYLRNQQAFYRESNASRLAYLERYGTYKERELAITQRYDAEIAATEDQWQKKILSKEKQQALDDLARQYSDASYFIFADAKSLTDNQLAKAIELTQQAIKKAVDSGDIQALSELYERLKTQMSVQNERSRGWGFAGILSGLDKREAAEYADYIADLAAQADPNSELAKKNREAAAILREEAENDIKNGIAEVADVFSELGGILESFDGQFDDFGNALASIGQAFSGIASQAQVLATALDEEATDTEKFASAIQAALTLASMVASSIINNKKAQDEWNLSIAESEQRMRMLKLEALDYKQQNIFGVENPYKKAIDGAQQYAQAMEDLQGLQARLLGGKVQTDTKKAIDWGNVGKGVAAGAAIGAVAGGGVLSWATAIVGAIGGAVGALSTKTVPVLENLRDVYGELWDSEYNLSDELVANYDKLDDETKQIVDSWDEIRDKALEAQAAMEETFSNLAGNIGKELSDSLVDAFRNGNLNSAIDGFHDKMTSTIEDIVQQMVFSNVFGDMFDQLQEEMKSSFDTGGDRNIVDDLMRFTDTYQTGLAEYQEQMKEAQEYMRGQGYDAWQSDQRKAQTRSALGASQDSIDESNARLTTIQGHTYELNENVRKLVAASGLSGFTTPDLAMGRTDYTEAIALIGQQVALQSQQIAALGAIVAGIQTDTAGIAEGTNTMILQSADSIKTSNKIQRGLEQVVDSGLRIK